MDIFDEKKTSLHFVVIDDSDRELESDYERERDVDDRCLSLDECSSTHCTEEIFDYSEESDEDYRDFIDLENDGSNDVDSSGRPSGHTYSSSFSSATSNLINVYQTLFSKSLPGHIGIDNKKNNNNNNIKKKRYTKKISRNHSRSNSNSGNNNNPLNQSTFLDNNNVNNNNDINTDSGHPDVYISQIYETPNKLYNRFVMIPTQSNNIDDSDTENSPSSNQHSFINNNIVKSSPKNTNTNKNALNYTQVVSLPSFIQPSLY